MNPVRSWPAYAVAMLVGLFCLVVGAAWIADHVVRGAPVDDTALIVAGATLARVVTIGIALAAVRPWGCRVPAPLLTASLWGCAAAQLAYPVAETAVKLATLAGLLDLPGRGVGDMSATGWLVFGAPGLLFALLARDHRRRTGGSWWWSAAGVGGGVAALFAIGAVIG